MSQVQVIMGTANLKFGKTELWNVSKAMDVSILDLPLL